MEGKTGLLKTFAHLPAPLAIITENDLIVEEANDAFFRFFGNENAVLQKAIDEIFPGFNEAHFIGIKDVLLNNGIYEIEKLNINTGTENPVKHISLSFSAVYDEKRKRHIGVSARDVTTSILQEKILQQNDTRFENLINQAPMATAVYAGEDMVIQVANPTMLKLWGKDESVIGKKLRDALPELEGQPFHALLKNVYETGIAYHSEEDKVDLMINGKLQTGYFNFTYKPLFNHNNRVYAILNMAVDVTSHVEDKKQLLNVQETTRLALESAELGTWILYPQNDVVEWDERCKELYGFPKEDVIPYLDVLKHMHPADRDNVHAAVSKALDPNSDGSYACEFRTIGASDKKLRWLRCKGKAYFDDKGQPYRFAGTAQDITPEVNQREEQGKLLMLIENSTDFVAISDLKGKITYMNKAGREMIGIDTDADVTSIDGKLLYHYKSDYPDTFDLPIDYLEKGTWQKILELRNLKTDEGIPCQVDYVLLRNPSGEISGRGATVKDLRPAIAAKKALEESENLLRNITTEAPIALWMSDEAGQITYINQTWIDWTGIPYEKQMGYGWTNAIIEEDRQRALNKFIEDVKARRPYEVDFRIRNKDGSIRWTVAKGNTQFDSEGVFIGYIGSNTDITENIVAEKKLRVTNEQLNHQIKQFEFVTDVMPQMVWVTRADGYHEYYNERWYEFTGRTYEQTKNQGWADLLHPEDSERTWLVWKHSLQTGQPYEIEYRMRRFDGEYRWLLARALPLLNDDDNIVNWFGTCTDIHEQKVLERQKDDFLGIASHELKTPVTSIKAYAQVLESILSKKGDEKEALMASKMNSQINRLTNLIGDLLDVTKINSGRLQFNKTLFLFNEMVAEMIEELQRTAHHHTIVEKFEGSALVFGDRERIGQVITNMITNAIKYSPHADKIIVHTSIEENRVLLCVEDFGVGIAKDKQDKVFEQFYRVSGDMQHTFPGLGLGLYISSEIIKREGGHIWVNSNEGKGSTFCFSLPVNNE